MNKHTLEIEQFLRKQSLKNDKKKAEKLKHYLGTKLQVHGLISKTQDAISKQGFSFYTENKDKTLSALTTVFKQSPSHEGKNQAFLYLDNYYKSISIETQLKTIPYWVDHVDNWAHSDYLSKFLTRLVTHPESKKEMGKFLLDWNTSNNLWKRRQSLVSLFYYSRTKKECLDFLLVENFITPLIHDKEYFVQKGIGWTLRESYNVYPKETYELIKKHIGSIHPAAFTTCLEKMTEGEKLQLKELRKLKRKK